MNPIRSSVQIVVTGLVILFLWSTITGCQSNMNNREINLAGTWKFRVDSLDLGLQETWFNQQLQDTVHLPGSMNANGKGNDISLQTNWTGQIVDSSYFTAPKYARYREPGNIKIPFWLQPLKHYVGVAWYQKTVDIPGDWKDQHIDLFLERCHWETTVWVDDNKVGMENTLGSPHIFDLTNGLTPGKHQITIRVDNRIKDIDVGINSHSITDHTQTNWNGIVGKIALESQPKIYISDVQVYPDIQKKMIRVKVAIQNSSGNVENAKISLKVSNFNSSRKEKLPDKTKAIQLPPDEVVVDLEYGMGDDPLLWDEFEPNLYQLKVQVTPNNNHITATKQVTFGMREITTKGRHILVNGRQVFLRGTLECAIFPKTGYPATEVADWLRIFRIIKSFGLNHMRFHSWCPPEAAFEAADREGIYLHVENSSWANTSSSIGDGKPIDEFLYKETAHNLKQYGNHPSFCMMDYGNEPAGKNQVDYLTRYVNYWKIKDPRRIYSSGSGWPMIPVNDYHITPAPRIQAWGAGLNSIINSQPPQTMFDFEDFIQQHDKPIVSHEIGQWCVYPNFKEISKYNGLLRAKNFEIFRESLEENHMGALADSFLLASGKLQALCYKADIETALRTKDQAGFELLDLHDFPGQGTALVGVLDPFWDEKGYISAQEYHRFCNATVPLVRLPKRVYLDGETLEASVEIAHFGPQPLRQVQPEWKLTGPRGSFIADGKLPIADIPIGNGIGLGKISVKLQGIKTAEKVVLTVKVNEFENSWDLWVYPGQLPVVAGSEDFRVVQNLDQSTIDFLEQGGKVLLTLKKGSLKPDKGGDADIGFSSIFWNTAWTRGQAPHTLGILCNPSHPALSAFPSEYYSNWQWWDAMSHSDAILLSDFPPSLKPIVRVIDDWFDNQPLGLIFEVKVSEGKLLISGIDLLNDVANRPEARQLLFSLKKYMASDSFQPKTATDISIVKGLIANN